MPSFTINLSPLSKMTHRQHPWISAKAHGQHAFTFFVYLRLELNSMPYTQDLLKVTPTGFTLAPGRILISVPFFNDTFFNRSVVLLTDYDVEQGQCAGLIVNHQLHYSAEQLVDGLHVADNMYLGGPVQPSALFLMHNFESCTASSRIVPNIYVGYDKVLLALIETRAIPSLRYKFMMGYAGWSPGQLEEELRKNMWVVGNPTPELVFDTPADQVWSRAVSVLGKEYEHWLKIPKYVNLN